jgi:hypothetical protein
MTQTKAWFEVDHKGMRELHSGRESWQVIKELVSNSFDEESASECHVTLHSITDRRAKLTVRDNGKGFANIKDAWTLMAHTPKRAKPTVRGRFNIGEKELLCTARSATILTSGYKITFTENGRRIAKHNTDGTTITAVLYLGSRQVETAITALERILPPKEITYTINGKVIPHKIPDKIIESLLETVIWKDGIESHPHRQTQVEIYYNDNWLYEMGIPVQPIECPYGVNVLQKIPMPPNRDVVKDTYLQDIYTTVLNLMSPEVQNPSDTWVHTAIEDKDIKPEAVKNIITKRYGDKVVLWSQDPRANDKARLAGYEVVHGRTLSGAERNALTDLADVQYSSEAFPTNFKTSEVIPQEKWTEGMIHTVEYAKYLHRLLLGQDLTVDFISDMQISASASYGRGYLSLNKVHLGNDWFDKVTPNMTGLLLHEFAHNKGSSDSEHDSRWYAEFQRLAGLAVHYATVDKGLQEYCK